MDNSKPNEKKSETPSFPIKTLEETLQSMPKATKIYLTQLMSIIACSLDLALQPPLSNEALFQAAVHWESRMRHIPIERLSQVFDKACQLHASSFPIICFDLLRAYEVVKNSPKPLTPEEIAFIKKDAEDHQRHIEHELKLHEEKRDRERNENA